MNHPSENKYNHKASLIYLLIKMAEADNEIHYKELAFIREIAHRIGLSDADIDNIKKHKNFELDIPSNEQERVYMFFHALQLVEIDRKILEDEIELLKKIGFRMGINPLLVNDLVTIYVNNLGKEISVDELSQTIAKYLN
ncbi:MAG: TerB family tellurite resistance protein [Bacteroidia bacterium]